MIRVAWSIVCNLKLKEKGITERRARIRWGRSQALHCLALLDFDNALAHML
jgi:hypothetical protein